ncbi:hypothetical protein B9Z35_08995 [Limnohabitans sp. Jir61]|nr:hypothetical protein B9Z35_08995 [Limnohabitans sp. Jir61]
MFVLGWLLWPTRVSEWAGQSLTLWAIKEIHRQSCSDEKKPRSAGLFYWSVSLQKMHPDAA